MWWLALAVMGHGIGTEQGGEIPVGKISSWGTRQKKSELGLRTRPRHSTKSGEFLDAFTIFGAYNCRLKLSR